MAPSARVVIGAGQFWDVNDTFGHKTGDEALPMVGQGLADWLRREAARKGNED